MTLSPYTSFVSLRGACFSRAQIIALAFFFPE